MYQPIAYALAFSIAAIPGLAVAQHKKDPAPSADMHQHMMKGSKESMAMKPSGDVDRDFVRFMRHHHQTGVQMAEQEIRHGKDPKAKELAQKIAASQKEEIKAFDEWLKEHGGDQGAKGKK